MKKILFITHTISSGGGAEKVLNTLIDELSSDYQIDVLEWLEDVVCPFWEREKNVRHIGSIAYSDRKAAQLGKSIRINKIKHVFLALINIFFPRFLYKRHIDKQYDYEISFNYLYTSALVAHSPNKISKKIMWIHGAIDDLNSTCNLFDIKYRLYKWLQHNSFLKGNAVIAISKKTHESIVMFEPKIENRIVDIYNGYNFNEIIQKSQTEYINKGKKFRLISLGRLSSVKNVRLQLEAMKLLKVNNIEVELFVLGEGEQEQEIKKYADCNPNVKLIGFKNNPYPYLASSDALIITSFSEGFPTIAVEAMALGMPVISTPVAGTEELITDDTGYIVEWDAESVAEGIKKVMITSYDSNVIKQHVSRYTKEKWAENIKSLFNKLDNE